MPLLGAICHLSCQARRRRVARAWACSSSARSTIVLLSGVARSGYNPKRRKNPDRAGHLVRTAKADQAMSEMPERDEAAVEALWALVRDTAAVAQVDVERVFAAAPPDAWAAEDGGKWTPLHYLMQSEQLTAEMLGLACEKAGADAWAVEDWSKNTPLHCLMRSEQLTAQMVGLTYEKAGADAWAAEGEYKRTPLHYLMQSKQLTAEMVGLAYEKAGADAWGAEDQDKRTPLHYLMRSKQLTAEMVGLAYE
eukprot:COSAG06_NODE_10306_length_1706_cov_2.313628_1_plen_250_part_10